MGKVHLVQWMCRQRHALLAVAWVEGESTFDLAVEEIHRVAARLKLNHACGICGSADLHFEDGATRWNTMREAAPHLAQQMIDNLKTRSMLDDAGLTVAARDAKHRN